MSISERRDVLELQAEVARLREENERLRADLTEYEGVVEKYMDELAEERREVERLREDRDEWKTVAEGHERQLELLREENAQQHADLGQAIKAMHASEKENADMRSQVGPVATDKVLTRGKELERLRVHHHEHHETPKGLDLFRDPSETAELRTELEHLREALLQCERDALDESEVLVSRLRRIEEAAREALDGIVGGDRWNALRAALEEEA